MNASSIKEKAMFVLSVALAVAAIHYGQKKFGTMPVIDRKSVV